MSSVVLLGGMVAIGAWVSEKIESSVTYNTAVNTAFYIDSFVGPHAQQLATRDRLSQELALKKRILELSDLRNRLKNASKRSTELNERFLRRVGSDLHDGPAQLLGLAILRLDAIRQLVMATHQIPTAEYKDLDIVQDALKDALSEIRNISAGLVLPELDGMNPAEVLTKAVSTHEYRTHTDVSLNLGRLPTYIGKSIQICLYRLVQEGLNNAERHAPRRKLLCKRIVHRQQV